MNAHWIVGLAHLLDPWVAGYLAFAIVVFLGLWGWAVRLIFQAWTGSQVARRRFAMVFGAGTGVLAHGSRPRRRARRCTLRPAPARPG